MRTGTRVARVWRSGGDGQAGREPDPALLRGVGHPSQDARVVAFHGRYRFPVSPAELWAQLRDVDRFEDRWRWLREVEATAPTLRTGLELCGVVAPPVPFTMRVTVALDDVVPEQRITASVTGDLHGPARLEITGAGDGSVVGVAWRVEMREPAMRAAAVLSRPLLLWGHDRVVAHTVRRFRSQLTSA